MILAAQPLNCRPAKLCRRKEKPEFSQNDKGVGEGFLPSSRAVSPTRYSRKLNRGQPNRQGWPPGPLTHRVTIEIAVNPLLRARCLTIRDEMLAVSTESAQDYEVSVVLRFEFAI